MDAATQRIHDDLIRAGMEVTQRLYDIADMDPRLQFLMHSRVRRLRAWLKEADEHANNLACALQPKTEAMLIEAENREAWLKAL